MHFDHRSEAFAPSSTRRSDDWVYHTPGDSPAGFKGDFGRVPLRQGLRLHYCDGADRHDRTSEAILSPGLALYLFMNGQPDATLGDRALLPTDVGAPTGPRAVLVSRTRPELLVRRGRRGEHAHKLAVTISQEWLDDCGLTLRGDSLDLTTFASTHLAHKAWVPHQRVLAAADRVLRSSQEPQGVQRLLLESRVIELLAETFRTIGDTPQERDDIRLKARDRQRVRRVEDFIEATEPSALSLGALADCAGVSVSTLLL